MLVACHLEKLNLPARSFRTIHHGEIWTISKEEQVKNEDGSKVRIKPPAHGML